MKFETVAVNAQAALESRIQACSQVNGWNGCQCPLCRLLEYW